MKAVSADNIKLSINGKMILQDISLDIMKGEILAFIGLNGAGKSSFLRVLSNLEKPTDGIIKYRLTNNIAYVDQTISIDKFMSIEENFIFQGEIYHLDRAEIKKRMNYLIKAFNLNEFLDKPVYYLSGGMKRRADLAVNLISYPTILFLDEPTASLDLNAKRLFWEELKKFQKDQNTTIVLTTHDLEEAEYLCDRIVFLDNGRIIQIGTPESLNTMLKRDKLIVYADKDIQESICKIQGLTKFASDKHMLEIWATNPENAFNKIIRMVYEQQLNIEGIVRQKITLKDLFKYFTKENVSYD